MTNNNDLISREALKKAVNKIIDEEIDIDEKWARGLKYSLKIIDNAPSVFSCNACKNMGNEWECVDCHDYSNYVHYEERTQGEWIIVKDKKWGDNVKCPFCKKELAGTDLNFCCKCGARLAGSEKMKGGAV